MNTKEWIFFSHKSFPDNNFCRPNWLINDVILELIDRRLSNGKYRVSLNMEIPTSHWAKILSRLLIDTQYQLHTSIFLRCQTKTKLKIDLRRSKSDYVITVKSNELDYQATKWIEKISKESKDCTEWTRSSHCEVRLGI